MHFYLNLDNLILCIFQRDILNLPALSHILGHMTSRFCTGHRATLLWMMTTSVPAGALWRFSLLPLLLLPRLTLSMSLRRNDAATDTQDSHSRVAATSSASPLSHLCVCARACVRVCVRVRVCVHVCILKQSGECCRNVVVAEADFSPLFA